MNKNKAFTPLEIKISNWGNKRFLTGFTLIEVLISAAIISLVAIGVYSVFSSGINVYKRGNQASSYQRKIRLVCERLSRELRNTFKFADISLEGKEDTLAFTALIENKESEDKPQYQVGRISYFINERGFLCKRQETYPESLADATTANYDELIPGVKELNLSYCYLDNATGDYKWKDDWLRQEQDSIPKAVKVELVLRDKPEQNSIFTKTVLIPIGTGEQKIELTK